MYSQGETFYYEIDGDDVEFTVRDDINYDEKEYIIAEDDDENLYVFHYDEDEDEFFLVEDESDTSEILSYWQDGYMMDEDNDIGDYDDDEYYDKQDKIMNDLDGLYKDDKNYF